MTKLATQLVTSDEMTAIHTVLSKGLTRLKCGARRLDERMRYDLSQHNFTYLPLPWRRRHEVHVHRVGHPGVFIRSRRQLHDKVPDAENGGAVCNLNEFRIR